MDTQFSVYAGEDMVNNPSLRLSIDVNLQENTEFRNDYNSPTDSYFFENSISPSPTSLKSLKVPFESSQNSIFEIDNILHDDATFEISGPNQELDENLTMNGVKKSSFGTVDNRNNSGSLFMSQCSMEIMNSIHTDPSLNNASETSALAKCYFVYIFCCENNRKLLADFGEMFYIQFILKYMKIFGSYLNIFKTDEDVELQERTVSKFGEMSGTSEEPSTGLKNSIEIVDKKLFKNIK